MRKWLSSFWKNYKYRFVPWIIVNLKQNKKSSGVPVQQNSDAGLSGQEKGLEQQNIAVPSKKSSMIVHHVNQGDDKLLSDDTLLNILVTMCEKLLEYEKEDARLGKEYNPRNVQDASELSKIRKELMHSLFGFSVERRKSHVGENTGTGVFLASGHAKSGALIALYPGTVYLPSEPLFFQSLGNSFIFRCSDNVHIDGNDKWMSKSVYKSCAARDKFRVDLPCCDESWLTPSPINPLNVGQYVNNRSKTQENNVVYQESQLIFDCDGVKNQKDSSSIYFPVHLCKYLPNVWANPENNHHPLRIVPLVAVKEINEGDEILSSYFTLVHADKKKENS